MITILLWTLLALHALALVAAPWAVGRERKPLTATTAGIQSGVNLVVIAMIILVLAR